MRIILMFDLPSTEDYEKKEYLAFKKTLLKNGYVMMQFSIYMKCISSPTLIDNEIKKIRKNTPSDGNVRILVITEKQYNDMRILVGNKKINEIYNNKERYVKI